MGSERWDFFISYTRADRDWAEWIAWTLEDADYKVVFQKWDFVPGSNWTVRMQEGVRGSARTIAVLSTAYLRSVYGEAEWQAAWAEDPQGFERKLVPVRVGDCDRPGLLGQIVSFDLFGMDEASAKKHLLDQIAFIVAGRAKPSDPPIFPGDATFDSPNTHAPSRRPVQSARVVDTTSDPQATAAPRAGTPRGQPRTADPTLVTTLEGHSGPVRSIAFSPSGQVLAVASQDHTATLWDVREPSEPRQMSVLTDHTDWVRAVAFSRSGGTLATASDDRTIKLWDVQHPARPSRLGVIEHATHWVRDISFSPTGDLVAAAIDDKTGSVWGVSGKGRVTSLATLSGHRAVIHAVRFSPAGNMLAMGSTDETASLWDLANPHGIRRIRLFTSHRAAVHSVAFAPRMPWLATGSYDRTVALRRLDAGDTNSAPSAILQHSSMVNHVDISHDGAFLVVADRGGDLTFWQVANPLTPQLVARAHARQGALWTAKFSPDGTLLASAGSDGTVRLWSAVGGAPLGPRRERAATAP